MLLDQVTDSQIRAAQIATGATIAVLMAAPLFGRQARFIRLGVTVVYIGLLIAAIVYFLL